MWNYGDQQSEGIDPIGTIVFDAAGNIYGTNASANPKPPYGTVWKFTP